MTDLAPKAQTDESSLGFEAGILMAQGHHYVYCDHLVGDSQFEKIGTTKARILWSTKPLLVVNAQAIRESLFGRDAYREAKIYDILELFAFICPTISCAPSLSGLSEALHLGAVETHSSIMRHKEIVTLLGQKLTNSDLGFRLLAKSGIDALIKFEWPWALFLMARLEKTQIPEDFQRPDPLRVWSLLEEWEDSAPRPPPSHIALGSFRGR